MKKNNKAILSLSIIPMFQACRVLNPEDFKKILENKHGNDLLGLPISELLQTTASLYSAAIIYGTALFLLGFVFFLLLPREKSTLYLSLTSILTAGIFSLSFWVDRVPLPEEFWSYAMIRNILLILFYQMHREWSRKAFYHRTKTLSYVLNSLGLSLVLITSLLSGHFPVIVNYAWPVPVFAIGLMLDSFINSLLSFQRKSDRSGIAGMLNLLPLTGLTIWIILSTEETDVFTVLNQIFYTLPALLLPWQWILAAALTLRRYGREQDRAGILMKMIDEEEHQKEKLEELAQAFEDNLNEEKKIPEYSLECAKRLLSQETQPQADVPETWSAYQSLNSESSAWPALGAWNRKDMILLVEKQSEKQLLPLLYIHHLFQNQKMKKPALLFRELNESMSSLPQNAERGLSSCFLYFMDEEVLCGTAGSVRVYLQKSKDAKIIPIQGSDKVSTYIAGLGVRAQTREDGKPFRIKAEKGDRIILVSCSLTDREQDMTGEFYGQKSLFRVLNNHARESAEKTVKAIMKDFEDFDMGNTADRDVFAGVYLKN